VGAGPGDPDLLTLRALRLIRQADVVVYDRLVSEPIMALVRQDSEKIHVGKEKSNHSLPQEKINQLLVRLAQEGKRVIRLKGGDPFIFGRGGEEIEELAAAGIPFQVVPGITAASGCASYSGIPLTHRDHSQSVRLITGHLKDDSSDLPWPEFVSAGQTLVFYMGLTGLQNIQDNLLKNGMAVATPVALISKGTTAEQIVVTGTLKEIVSVANQVNLKAPTLIIVGTVVSLRDKLRWFD
jgi:uroporphyrin-III C-methyltransferase/precorrin-2 dehydrogenase/sirohydrochlorin ferrochelatase